MARRLARRVAGDDPLGQRGQRALRRLDRAALRGHHTAIDAAWEVWLDHPAPALWELLSRSAREPSGHLPENELQLCHIAMGRLPVLWDRGFGDVITAALAKGDHPVARTARELILAAPAETVEAVCAVALADPGGVVARFCAGHGLTPPPTLCNERCSSC